MTVSKNHMCRHSPAERMSAWRKSVLEADAKYAGIASEDTSHPQAIIFNWKAGLQPLSV